METAAFQQQVRWLTDAPPGDAWFVVLRNVYRQASSEQREELRQMLGWSDRDCREPADAVAADFADKHRAYFRTNESFRAYLVAQANGVYPQDPRDALLSIAGLYYLLILRGFDPATELNAVADACTPDSASAIRSFLERPDKALEEWRYEPVRLPDDSVTLHFVGM